ncbi:MAG TPA: carboxypeptidase regulatory-like domain-containing protein [Terriglobales bacterium]|nr:carboxypeptidase regulatory-like domain-containing protein [Terriglobales bacterium]
MLRPQIAIRIASLLARAGAAAILVCFSVSLFAAASGSLSGTLKDPTGAVIVEAKLTLVNTVLKSEYVTKSNGEGFYSFPALPVGSYDLTIDATGFETQEKTNLAIDTDAALTLDAVLSLGERSENIMVEGESAAVEVQVDTVATHLGELVTSSQMTALPLNGRSYTDLLPIQPGVAPVSTLLPNSVIMAGVTGGLSPSGDLNPGNLSIDGQRESSNGFLVDGIDVQEHMNGGTSIVANLDSIDEFRVLTNNFDPEYGNYNGGMVTVITKSGSDRFHGNAFEFLRNTGLDARGYFDPSRPVFRQNQFGGTLGGPIQRGKVYFFADYQGTRTNEGVETGNISVPSVQDRTGNLFDQAGSFVTTDVNGNTVPTTVSGPSLAGMLSQDLGYGVTAGEPYYTAGCTTNSSCVFPNAVIPVAAWSAPALALLPYIPSPNSGADQFSTSAYPQTVRDDKSSGRIDANVGRWGQFSAYYFFDDYRLDNPYPGQQGGASIPGFDALTFGRAQLISLGDTKVFGAGTVNEFHSGYLRYANVIGQPHGGLGISQAAQGFSANTGAGGFLVQAPQFEGVENIVFPSFVMGVPITNETQTNNTLYLSDMLSKVIGTHTLKFGGQFHWDQVNEHPNATFNGTFNIDGTETGSAFADFLIGVPSNFTQSSGQPFYPRNRYAGLFAQDSWRARSDLTINAGLRWDYIMPFWEKYNNIQTVIPGRQSLLYPGLPQDLVVPGDPGIPSTISPSKPDNFAPRIGFAYAPRFDHGILRELFGDNGKSSIRASYGIFYTAFPGLSAGVMYGVAPFGDNYLSPEPPLFATPFINAADGGQNTNPFPLAFPPHKVSATNPDTQSFASVIPISADVSLYYRDAVPYTENYMLSFERQITTGTLLTINYVGNEGHHILAVVSNNPANQALCLSLSQPSEVAPGSPTCGPFGEDAVITSAGGQVYQGVRDGLGSNYHEDTWQQTIENSSYNALETNLRYVGHRSTFLLGYTYSKSIDQGSNLGEQLDPLNHAATRAISAWDMKHNFVGSFKVDLPFDLLSGHNTRLSEGWSIAGTARLSTGLPVTLLDDSDNSLLGTLGNGINNYLLDTPEYHGAPLDINTNPRNGRPAFNNALAAFTTETRGQLGNVPRRFFYGPGIDNFDLALTKMLKVTESKSFEFRLEAFNALNHAQFYGAAAVDGEVNDPHFGQVVSAAAPRLVQLGLKFAF